MPDQAQTNEESAVVADVETPSPADILPEAFLLRKKQLQALAEERWTAYRINRLARLDITRKLAAFLKPFVENRACLENGWQFAISVSEDDENQIFVITGAFLPFSVDIDDEPLIAFTVLVGDNVLGWSDILYHSEMALAEDLESLQDVLANRMADLVFGFLGPAPDENTDLAERTQLESGQATEIENIGPEDNDLSAPTSDELLEDLPPLEDLSGSLGWVHLNSIRELSSIELKQQLQEFVDSYQKQVAFEILPAEEYFFSTDPGDLNAKRKAFRLLMWVEGKQSAADLESILLEAITSGYLTIEDAKATEVVDCQIPAMDTPEERLAQIAEDLRKGG